MDLFSGVDVFFFNLYFLNGLFFILSFLWVSYFFIFSFFSYLNINFFLYNWLYSFFLTGLDDVKGFSLKGWYSFLWSFFLLITLGNFSGLLPYIYGVTTNIYMVLFLSFWGWVVIIFSSFVSNFFLFIGHFCPASSPLALGWFLSLVEVISTIIRPGTLTLRLVANMTTGHILIGLMTLTSCSLLFSSSFYFLLLVMVLQGYILFEFFICLIQGNVFFMLLGNYSSEHLLKLIF